MVERSLRRRAVLAVVGLVAVSVGVVSPVAADDGVVATETGEALEVAGSLVADAAPLSDTGDGFVAVVAGSEVELPADPAESLVLDGATGEIGVDLPVVAGLDDGVVDESGAVVYQSDTSPVSLAAQATEDGGMQVLVVIDGPDAPTEYRFGITVPAGAVLLPSTDGGAVVVDAEGVVVAAVAPAWAVDANGQTVPTQYRIDGTTLVQVIDHHGAAYPVVGDPCWSCIVNAAIAVVTVATTVAVAAGACAVGCAVVGAVAGVAGVGMWIAGNTKSCRNQKVNVWRRYYFGC